MPIVPINIPAILSLFRVARDPSLCLPHATVLTFADLPIPLSRAFRRSSHKASQHEETLLQSDEKTKLVAQVEEQEQEQDPDIRAIVLDKDNCFAIPHTDSIFPAYSEKFKALLSTYGRDNVLIVSNSSGTLSKDPQGVAADVLERNTGVKVLRHRVEKPGCGQEIMAYFRRQTQQSGDGSAQIDGVEDMNMANDEREEQAEETKGKEVTDPSQIVVIGDRLFTDVVMANMMGARAVWIKEGVVKDRGFVTRMEYAVEGWLRRKGWTAREVLKGERT